MQFFKNDVGSVVELCEHELFHNIQAASCNSNTISERLQARQKGRAYAYDLLRYLFREGTAEYVADLEKADKTSPYLRELWEHMAVNKQRAASNFYLLERTVLDVASHPESVNFNQA